jgi:D-amino-acid oxidase
LAINCTGLGARELVNDDSLYAIRGQIVRVARAGIEKFLLDEDEGRGVAYIIPRSDDCVLGGTAEDRCENTEPDAKTSKSIFERCAAIEPRLRDAMILSHAAGLRPGRAAIRLEVETWASGKALIHNYGHGGAGVTLSWGCAREVTKLAKRYLL